MCGRPAALPCTSYYSLSFANYVYIVYTVTKRTVIYIWFLVGWWNKIWHSAVVYLISLNFCRQESYYIRAACITQTVWGKVKRSTVCVSGKLGSEIRIWDLHKKLFFYTKIRLPFIYLTYDQPFQTRVLEYCTCALHQTVLEAVLNLNEPLSWFCSPCDTFEGTRCLPTRLTSLIVMYLFLKLLQIWENVGYYEHGLLMVISQSKMCPVTDLQ